MSFYERKKGKAQGDVYRERELCVYLFKTIWEKRKPKAAYFYLAFYILANHHFDGRW